MFSPKTYILIVFFDFVAVFKLCAYQPSQKVSENICFC